MRGQARALLIGLLSGLLMVPPAWATIAYDNGQGYAGASNVTSYTDAYTTGSGTDRGMSICVFMFNSPVTTVASVTYNGVNLTQVGSATLTFGSAGTLRLEQWFLANPTSGNNNFTITPSALTDRIRAVVNTYTGVHQTTSTGTGATNAENVGNGPVTVDVSSASGEWVSDCAYINSANAAPTIGPGQTLRGVWDDTGVSGHWFGSSTEDGAGTTTMSWTLGQTGKDWGTVAFPIKPAGGGGAAAPRNLLLMGVGQ